MAEGRIQQLDDLTIGHIAAGEVVEDSDSDMDYDLTQVEIERRAKDEALRKTKRYYNRVRIIFKFTTHFHSFT